MPVTALHPLVYLPFHLAGHHMTARAFSHKPVTYPLHLAFSLMQFTVEHFSAEFPTLASANGALVAITVSLVPVFYYCAYHKTTGPKSHVWLAIGMFLITLPVFQGLELGFPKDDPTEQAAANLDPVHSYWHLVLHVVITVNLLVATYHVPWHPKAEVEVPASPGHSTLAQLRTNEAGFGVPDSPCSPRKRPASATPGGRLWPKALWPKTKFA